VGSRRQKNICSCKPLKANPASLLHFNYPAVRSPPRTRARASSKTFRISKGQAQRLGCTGAASLRHSKGCTSRRVSRHPLSLRCPGTDPSAALARLTAALSRAWLFTEGGSPVLRGRGFPWRPCSASPLRGDARGCVLPQPPQPPSLLLHCSQATCPPGSENTCQGDFSLLGASNHPAGWR